MNESLFKFLKLIGGGFEEARRKGEALSVPSKQALLAALLLTSFAFKVYFTLHLTHYTGALVSDMGFYWGRAHERFNGNYFSQDQWHANPPFFPMFLEQVFKILFFLGLSAHELVIVLVLFSALSTLSVLAVFGIAARLTGGFWRAFLPAAFYAFAYPMIYYNAFVLTENLAIPLLILVFWLVIHREGSLAWMGLAGILFGAAVAIRVALGINGLFIFLYLWAAKAVSWRGFKRALGFSASFFSIVFLLLVENFFISHGQLRGLAGYFGFNVFLQYCKVRNAWSGNSFYNNPTFIGGHPEFGVFHTDHPFHDRAYFLDLVRSCIDNNPHIWIDNLKLFKDIFVNPPWPSFSNLWGYGFWMMPFCYLTLFLGVSIGLFYWVAPKDRLWKSRITLLLSPFICALVMCYFFGMEGRLLIPSLFGLYIVFFATLPLMLKQYRKSGVYYLGVGLIFLFFTACSHWQRGVLRDRYGVERMQKVALEQAGKRVPDGTPGDTWGFFIMPNVQSGILLESKTRRKVREIEISTDSMDQYHVEFYLDHQRLGEIFLPLITSEQGGTYKRRLRVPNWLKGIAFNRILVRPESGDGFYSLAYLILDPV